MFILIILFSPKFQATGEGSCLPLSSDMKPLSFPVRAFNPLGLSEWVIEFYKTKVSANNRTRYQTNAMQLRPPSFDYTLACSRKLLGAIKWDDLRVATNLKTVMMQSELACSRKLLGAIKWDDPRVATNLTTVMIQSAFSSNDKYNDVIRK
jgi:hypothetical protein